MVKFLKYNRENSCGCSLYTALAIPKGSAGQHRFHVHLLTTVWSTKSPSGRCLGGCQIFSTLDKTRIVYVGCLSQIRQIDQALYRKPLLECRCIHYHPLSVYLAGLVAGHARCPEEGGHQDGCLPTQLRVQVAVAEVDKILSCELLRRKCFNNPVQMLHSVAFSRSRILT